MDLNHWMSESKSDVLATSPHPNRLIFVLLYTELKVRIISSRLRVVSWLGIDIDSKFTHPTTLSALAEHLNLVKKSGTH